MKRKINSFSICVFSLFILFTSCNTESIQKKEEKPVTFTFFSSDANGSESFNDLIAREITKRTGVKLEFVQNSKNASDAISLMIAGDQFPDFISLKLM